MEILIRVCYAHESRQVPLPLSGVSFTHGVCWPCFVRWLAEFRAGASPSQYENIDFHMSKHRVHWVQYFTDGGWRQRATNGYFPEYSREYAGREQRIQWDSGWDSEGQWLLYSDGLLVTRGNLDEVFEAAQ